MDILIPEAIIIGVVAGLVFHKLIGYLTIPVVGLAVGVWWAARHSGDIEGGTADIFNNQAPELIGETALVFAFAGAEAALACWGTIALLEYLQVRMSNRRRRQTISSPDRERPQRPT